MKKLLFAGKAYPKFKDKGMPVVRVIVYIAAETIGKASEIIDETGKYSSISEIKRLGNFYE